MAHLSAASLLLVVVRVRRLCAEDLRDRRAHRGVGRDGRDRHRDWHVGLARKGSEEGRNLWFGALGERTRSEAGQDARRRWRRSWPLRAALSAPRWSRTFAVFRAAPYGEGRRPRPTGASHHVGSDGGRERGRKYG